MLNIKAFLGRLEKIPQGMIIVVSAFLPMFAIISMFPALPFIIDHFKDNPNARELVPLMVSAPGLTIALVAPFAGVIVDKYGRVKMLVWSTFFYGFFGCAPFFLDDLTLMFGSRLALGVTEAFILTIVNTLIGDYWKDQGRRDWLFLQGLLGPAMGAVVIRLAGPATEIQWNGVFIIYAIAFVIFWMMKSYLYEPDKNEATVTEQIADKDSPFPVRAMMSVGVTTLVCSAIYYVFIISGGLVFREMGINEPSKISEMTAIPSLFVMFGAFLFRLLGNKSNAIQLASLFTVLGGGLFIIGTATSSAMLIGGLVIQQTGAGMAVPGLIAWTQTKLPFKHRGRGMGIWTSCFFFGQFSSPWLVARVEEMVGTVQSAFMVAGAIGLAMALIMLVGVSSSTKSVEA